MTHGRRARAVALTLCIAVCAVAQNERGASGSQPKSRTFQEARRAGATTSAVFEFELSGFAYRIAANGNGRRTKGRQTRRFNLKLDGGEYIERIYAAEYEGDLLLICGVTDEEAGAGLVARLEQPSMRALWKQRVPTSNVGEPLRDGRRLYVTATGTVGALDLKTGEYEWMHDGLYNKDAGNFNSFGPPEIKGDEVLFAERTIHNTSGKIVRVNRKTGKIIRIE
jgi:outer membrane protein assembly factor BamB